jgi:transaldolase
VLLTAVYSAGQSVAAAAIGARYVAPYLGRLQDAGRSGFDEIETRQRHRRLRGVHHGLEVAARDKAQAV